MHFAAETGSYEILSNMLQVAALLTEPKDCRMAARSHISINDILSRDEHIPVHVSTVCRDLMEAKDYKGRSALHFAVRTNQVRHARLLIANGAEVDSTDTVIGRTPLLLAIYWNHHNIIQLLLESGARLDVVDDNAMTVIHYIAKFGDRETLRIFSQVNISGISANCRNKQHMTPKDVFDDVRPIVMVEDNIDAAISKSYFEKILEPL